MRHLLVVAVLAALLAGCGSDPETGAPPSTVPEHTPVATAAPGFAPATPPPPAGTFSPGAGSWEGTDPEPGYRVVLVTTDQDDRTEVLSGAVRDWADDVDAELSEIVSANPARHVADIQQAIDEQADLVVSTGDSLVDAMSLVTASNLQQQFLVVGAGLAEPTTNVTAAEWEGAAFRGEGLGQHQSFDPATFTPERAGRAVRAGVAAVLTGLNGTVVRVD